MTGARDNLLEQLYDITGIDYISWWPLAPGWWVVLALASVLGGIVYWRRRAYQRSWKGEVWRALAALDSRLVGGNAQETAGALSVLLRRVAMQCSSRAECAGLEGQDWLRWLSSKDPGRFDWSCHGMLLIEIPYAPPGRSVSPESVKILIKAVKRWVK
jgi:Domain of unknown function (DUF4381)